MSDHKKWHERAVVALTILLDRIDREGEVTIEKGDDVYAELDKIASSLFEAEVEA